MAASDPQGFNVAISGDLNGIPFSCGSSCTVSLPEGVGTANYLATSTSGRTASGSSTWQRDATPPTLDILVPSINGMNGWYVSEVDVNANASDAISGLASIQASTNEGGTWISLPLHFADGIHPVTVRARDIAGNERFITNVVHIDTMPPISQFTSHSSGQVVQAQVTLSGELEDATSGATSGEISIDGGATWKKLFMDTDNTWSFEWNSNEVLNGQYSLQTRGMDRAGNIGDVAFLTLIVENQSPRVFLTDHWWIWESGRLEVSPNYFPISSVKVTISDPQNEWPPLVMKFDPDKIPSSISWNRHFADGTLAPSGYYRVMAVACDSHDLCGSDTGIVEIPLVATSTTTLPPSPTATLTLTPEATLIPTKRPANATPVLTASSPETPTQPNQTIHSFHLWPLIGLLGLFLAIASASVVDPRPAALDRLRESINLIASNDVVVSPKDENKLNSKGLEKWK